MGRMKTGLTRPKPIPVGLSEMEKELLARDAYNQRKSQAELLRIAYFKPGWDRRLKILREKQGAFPVGGL